MAWKEVQEVIATFGGAVLLKDLRGRFEIVGGTEAEQQQAKEWAVNVLHRGGCVHWYSRAFTRRMKLPRLRELDGVGRLIGSRDNASHDDNPF